METQTQQLSNMNKVLAGRKSSLLTEPSLGKGRPFSVTSWKMREREEKSLDYKLDYNLETELNYKRF